MKISNKKYFYLYVITILFTVKITAQTTWNKYSNNPIIDIGAVGTWDDTHVFAPTVIYDDGTYKMWYTGDDGSSKYRIGYATSLDGISWTKYVSNPVIDAGDFMDWDDEGVYAPTVIIEGGIYKMWYTGINGTVYGYAIGHATSPDGITWTKWSSDPVLRVGYGGSWDYQRISNPTVIIDGGTHKIWYSGYGGASLKIGLATGWPTLIKYTGNPVLDIGAVGTWDNGGVYYPTVIKNDGTYKMWYTGHGDTRQIGYATSSDGINWTKNVSNPVLDLGLAGTWDSDWILSPTVIIDNALNKMWYTGYDGTTRRIGYATSVKQCINGSIIYNTETGKFNFCENGIWVEK